MALTAGKPFLAFAPRPTSLSKDCTMASATCSECVQRISMALANLLRESLLLPRAHSMLPMHQELQKSLRTAPTAAASSGHLLQTKEEGLSQATTSRSVSVVVNGSSATTILSTASLTLSKTSGMATAMNSESLLAMKLDLESLASPVNQSQPELNDVSYNHTFVLGII